MVIAVLEEYANAAVCTEVCANIRALHWRPQTTPLLTSSLPAFLHSPLPHSSYPGPLDPVTPSDDRTKHRTRVLPGCLPLSFPQGIALQIMETRRITGPVPLSNSPILVSRRPMYPSHRVSCETTGRKIRLGPLATGTCVGRTKDPVARARYRSRRSCQNSPSRFQDQDLLRGSPSRTRRDAQQPSLLPRSPARLQFCT